MCKLLAWPSESSHLAYNPRTKRPYNYTYEFVPLCRPVCAAKQVYQWLEASDGDNATRASSTYSRLMTAYSHV